MTTSSQAAASHLYRVLDIKTKQVVATFKDSHRARAKRDQLNAKYGAVRYVVKSEVVYG